MGFNRVSGLNGFFSVGFMVFFRGVQAFFGPGFGKWGIQSPQFERENDEIKLEVPYLKTTQIVIGIMPSARREHVLVRNGTQMRDPGIVKSL